MSQWNKDYDKYIKENTAATNKKIEQRSAGLNQIVDNATNQAVGKVQTEIDKLPTAYQSAYDVNAIQQKINEREVAERMANLGLTNSGLNRTQQTAINIQRANADAALTQQKNAVTASLKQQIADLYASGENQKAQNKLNVYNAYMDELDSNAVAYANNQASNRAAVAKARIEAQAKKTKLSEEIFDEAYDLYDADDDSAFYNYIEKLELLGYDETTLKNLVDYVVSKKGKSVQRAWQGPVAPTSTTQNSNASKQTTTKNTKNPANDWTGWSGLW